MKILESQIDLSRVLPQSFFFLGGFVVIWVLLLFVIQHSKKSFASTTRFLSILTVIFFTISLVQIIGFETTRKRISPPPLKSSISSDYCEKNNCPDVYYIISEKYGSQKVLQDYFEFDNTEFISFLKSRGFTVASGSHANYLDTQPSLASSLSFNYLDTLASKMGPKSKDRSPMFQMFLDYPVWRFLKERGYTFIHVGPYWDVDHINPNADINYSYQLLGLNDFLRLYVETTVFYPIINSININNPLGRNVLHYNYTIAQVDALGEYSKEKSPKFVFAHLFLTHDPYVFSEEGHFIDQYSAEKIGYKQMYVNSLKFANKKYEVLIDKILANSKTPPIVVLQADEGPRSVRMFIDQKIPWFQSTDDEFRMKTSILNAYHLPQISDGSVYDTITPVNTFRLIFNHYFNANLELLPDKVFAHPDYINPYRFWDISNIVFNTQQ